MINKEQFIKLISEHLAWEDRVEEVGNIFNCFIYEADWIEYTGKLFDTTIGLIFKESAIDDIMWWMFEKQRNPELKVFDKDDNEIPSETIEDLWEMVKDNQNK